MKGKGAQTLCLFGFFVAISVLDPCQIEIIAFIRIDVWSIRDIVPFPSQQGAYTHNCTQFVLLGWPFV